MLSGLLELVKLLTMISWTQLFLAFCSVILHVLAFTLMLVPKWLWQTKVSRPHSKEWHKRQKPFSWGGLVFLFGIGCLFPADLSLHRFSQKWVTCPALDPSLAKQNYHSCFYSVGMRGAFLSSSQEIAAHSCNIKVAQWAWAIDVITHKGHRYFRGFTITSLEPKHSFLVERA